MEMRLWHGDPEKTTLGKRGLHWGMFADEHGVPLGEILRVKSNPNYEGQFLLGMRIGQRYYTIACEQVAKGLRMITVYEDRKLRKLYES